MRFFALVVLATFDWLFGVKDEAAIVSLLSLHLSGYFQQRAVMIQAIYNCVGPFHLDHRPAFF